MKVRMAYFDTLVRQYKLWPVDLSMHGERTNMVYPVSWKSALNDYKKQPRTHNLGNVVWT